MLMWDSLVAMVTGEEGGGIVLDCVVGRGGASGVGIDSVRDYE